MKKSSIKPNEVPYGISNAALAFALDLAGVPPAVPSCINLYDPDMLFRIGGGEKDGQGNVTQPSRFAGNGVDAVIAAAKAAVAEEQKGSVNYRFQRPPRLGPLCKAYSDQETKLKDGDTVNTCEMADEILSKLLAGSIKKDEAIVRMVCLIGKTNKPFKDQWKYVTPTIRLDNAGDTKEFATTARTRDAKGNVITVPAKGIKRPGWKIFSADISEETKKKLGLK